MTTRNNSFVRTDNEVEILLNYIQSVSLRSYPTSWCGGLKSWKGSLTSARSACPSFLSYRINSTTFDLYFLYTSCGYISGGYSGVGQEIHDVLAWRIETRPFGAFLSLFTGSRAHFDSWTFPANYRRRRRNHLSKTLSDCQTSGNVLKLAGRVAENRTLPRSRSFHYYYHTLTSERSKIVDSPLKPETEPTINQPQSACDELDRAGEAVPFLLLIRDLFNHQNRIIIQIISYYFFNLLK